MRGVAQPLDLLRPGDRLAVRIGQMVGDHHRTAGPDDARQLLEHPHRRGDVVQRKTGDHAVEGGIGQLQRGDVTDLEGDVVDAAGLPVAAGHLDHRRCQVDAVHTGHLGSQPPANDPWTAGGFQPSLVPARDGQAHQLVQGALRVGHRAGGECLGLAGELTDHLVIVHDEAV